MAAPQSHLLMCPFFSAAAAPPAIVGRVAAFRELRRDVLSTHDWADGCSASQEGIEVGHNRSQPDSFDLMGIYLGRSLSLNSVDDYCGCAHICEIQLRKG